MKITNSYIDLDKIHIEIDDFPAGEKYKPNWIRFSGFKGDSLSYELENLDTSTLTNSDYMFSDCSGLTSLDLSNFDFSNVTNVNQMFNGCYNLEEIILPDSLINSKVTTIQYLFGNCRKLRNLDLSIFDTSNTTGFNGFLSRSTGYNVPLPYNILKNSKITLDTSKATSFDTMFQGYCNTSLDVSELNVSKVKTMKDMFKYCLFLDDDSLDSILVMCSKNSLVTNKTLAYLGFTSNTYSASRIQALPHYQDFINAGWTIGY